MILKLDDLHKQNEHSLLNICVPVTVNKKKIKADVNALKESADGLNEGLNLFDWGLDYHFYS